MIFKNVYHDDYPTLLTNDSEQWSRDYSQFSGLPFAFDFEDNFRFVAFDRLQWMSDNWHYSVYFSFVYLLVIVLLKRWMNTRSKPFDLRKPLALWSASLALFSIMGTIRCLPVLIHVLIEKGFVDSVCEATYHKDIRVLLWYYLFTLSKVVELGDTLFIILRKQKLIVLHWIHHVLTLCVCWYTFGDLPAIIHWWGTMNYAVHSLMYSYYSAKALRFRFPKSVSIFITVTQIIQMMFGFIVNIVAFYYKLVGVACDVPPAVAIVGLGLYGLFFVLFVNFFMKSYIGGVFKCVKVNVNNNNESNSIYKQD